MKLRDIINLNNGDTISIVGAGGKTSLMFKLAEECRDSKVLVTTSTKIFVPDKGSYDCLALNARDGESFKLNKNPGIYVLGYDINSENKLGGIDDDILQDYQSCFNYIFIEADGSKRKPVKGWGDNEPVILNSTTKTIGVVSIKAINLDVNEENVHRAERFKTITGLGDNERIGVNEITALIMHKEGLFKNSLGKRILFVNQVESEEDINNANMLVKAVKNMDSGYIDRIIVGSLKNGSYRLY